MAVTASQFRARYREFDKASDSEVDDALARAETEAVNRDVWGTDAADSGVMVYAAHLLNAGPGGVAERATTYRAQYDAMLASLAAGPWVG